MGAGVRGRDLGVGAASPVADAGAMGGAPGYEGEGHAPGPRPQLQVRQLLQAAHDEGHHKPAHLWRWALCNHPLFPAL